MFVFLQNIAAEAIGGIITAIVLYIAHMLKQKHEKRPPVQR